MIGDSMEEWQARIIKKLRTDMISETNIMSIMALRYGLTPTVYGDMAAEAANILGELLSDRPWSQPTFGDIFREAYADSLADLIPRGTVLQRIQYDTNEKAGNYRQPTVITNAHHPKIKKSA